MKTEYNKLRTKIFGIVEGLALVKPEYQKLRQLLAFAEEYHNGHRKDGTREFSHQLEMLGLALTFHDSLSKPFDVYMAVVAHDLCEDYPGCEERLVQQFPNVAPYSRRLSKFYDKHPAETYYDYFYAIADCEVCSVVKLIDRVHNLSTAPGVFSTEKILGYCDEVDTYFYDMLKTAKIKFDQRCVYETLKFMLKTQTHTIRTLLHDDAVVYG